MGLGIKAKLTLLYATILGIGLVIFGWFLYFSLYRTLLYTTDERLRVVAEIMVRTPLGSQAFDLPQDFDLIFDRFFGIRTSGKLIQIIDPSGRVRLRSSSLKGLSIPFSEEAYKNGLKGLMTYETIEPVGGYPLRVMTYPVIDRGRLLYLLQVGSSIEGVRDTLGNLLFFLYLSIPMAIILSGLAGWLIATRALRPVEEMADAARRITAENLSERIEIKGQDEIGMLAETFNDMIARLEASFDRIKRFTADASHELRTPLTILKGEVEVALKMERTVEGLRKVLMSNLEEIDRLSKIVNDLLLLARMESNREEFRFSEVSLDELIEERYMQMRTFALDKGVKMEMEKKDGVKVKGDPAKLKQLFLNLMDNAIKYTPPGGRVHVSVGREDGFAVVTVSDTGIGIPQKDLPHIFDRFYRVERAGREGGSGLGLSICKLIVEAHGGRIDVESRQGRGSTFRVFLPIS